MCSIANLFNSNIRKFDAKKTLFFLPRMRRLCKSLEKKIIFFNKNKISVLEVNFSWKSNALNLRQPKLSASYKEIVDAIFQSMNATFLTWKSLSIVGTPLLFYKGETRGGGGSDFSSHKYGAVGKIDRWCCFKK